MTTTLTDDVRTARAVDVAREQEVSDDLEIDESPATSPADGGVWVAAWVWIDDDRMAHVAP